MSRTVEAATGRWFGILAHFGIDQQYLRNRHGPCPLCEGRDRFRWDDKNGSGSYICAQCGAGTGMSLLMAYTGMDFKAAAKAVDEVMGTVPRVEPRKPSDPRPRLRRIAEGVTGVDGINPVRKYLHSRGLKPAPATKYHPSLAYYEDGKRISDYPAMIHLLSAADGSPLTYHVTYLDQSGSKAPVSAPRKVLPGVGPLCGGAIRLCDVRQTMGIAEGIETALAATQQTGIPTWAAYSATLLEQFVPPSCVRHVVVFGDNDVSFTGQASAYALARRLVRDGISVEVRIPEQVGSDWADQA